MGILDEFQILAGLGNLIVLSIYSEVLAIGDDSNVAEMPRPYSCQLCQKSFTSHAYLASHIRKAHEKRFRCEECGKCYGGSSYLREHIEAVHRKTKNFICQFCSASFYSKTQLTNHCMRNHSEGK